MDNNQTSFIPKRELYTKVETPVVYQYSIFSIISFSLLVISILISVAVFVYQKILVNQISKINSELVAKKSAFEQDLIEELLKTDSRIESLKSILKNKTTIVPVFSMLEESTLETVRFVDFRYSLSKDGLASIDLSGEALSSASVALQSDILNSYPKISQPEFSSFAIADNGSVKFNFKANLNRGDFSYDTFIKNEKVVEGNISNDLSSDVPPEF